MRHTSFHPEKLEKAQKILEADGFEVKSDPFLLARGIVLAAWHAERDDGFLIKPSELGHIIHYGADYLDRDFQDTPRWKRDGFSATTRLHRYAEAIMARAVAEVATASPGLRNQTLNRCAFVLGQYLDWSAFTYEQADTALLDAALGIGLSEREAKPTIRAGLEAGQANPKDQSDLGQSSGFGSNGSNPKIYQTESEKTRFGVLGKGSRANSQSFGQLGVTKRFGGL